MEVPDAVAMELVVAAAELAERTVEMWMVASQEKARQVDGLATVEEKAVEKMDSEVVVAKALATGQGAVSKSRGVAREGHAVEATVLVALVQEEVVSLERAGSLDWVVEAVRARVDSSGLASTVTAGVEAEHVEGARVLEAMALVVAPWH
jgi:hypothetical protein